MIRILLTVAVVGAAGSFADLAMAQVKQGEPPVSEESSKCAHRRAMPPDPRADCVRAGGGIGPGSAIGQGLGTGQGIGPGNGGGQAKDRR